MFGSCDTVLCLLLQPQAVQVGSPLCDFISDHWTWTLPYCLPGCVPRRNTQQLRFNFATYFCCVSETQLSWFCSQVSVPKRGPRVKRIGAGYLKVMILLEVWYYIIRIWLTDRLCGLVVRVLGYRSGGPGSILSTTRKKSSGSGTGSTQPREYNWGATLIEK
jgi:hypothetical protein